MALRHASLQYCSELVMIVLVLLNSIPAVPRLQHPSVGTVSASGEMTIGSVPGSSINCTGQVNNDIFTGNCSINGNVQCTVMLNH